MSIITWAITNWKIVLVASLITALSAYIITLNTKLTSAYKTISELTNKHDKAILNIVLLEKQVRDRDIVIEDYKTYIEKLKEDHVVYVRKYTDIVERFEGQMLVTKVIVKKYNDLKFSKINKEANKQANKILEEEVWGD